MKRSPLSAGSGGAGSVLRIRLGGKFTPGVIAILVLHAVTYISLQLPGVGSFLAQTMLLWPAQALGTRPYQLLTAPLFMTSILALGFVALLLWSVGSAVEQKLGTRRFLLWAGLTSLVSTIAAAAAGRLIAGPSDQVVVLDGTALFPLVLLAFAQFYGDVRVTLWGVGQEVSGRGLSYFFVGLGLCTDLFGQRWAQLAAAAAAVLCTLLLGHGGGGLWAALRRRLRRRQVKGGLQILDGGRPGAPARGSGSQGGPQRWVN